MSRYQSIFPHLLSLSPLPGSRSSHERALQVPKTHTAGSATQSSICWSKLIQVTMVSTSEGITLPPPLRLRDQLVFTVNNPTLLRYCDKCTHKPPVYCHCGGYIPFPAASRWLMKGIWKVGRALLRIQMIKLWSGDQSDEWLLQAAT